MAQFGDRSTKFCREFKGKFRRPDREFESHPLRSILLKAKALPPVLRFGPRFGPQTRIAGLKEIAGMLPEKDLVKRGPARDRGLREGGRVFRFLGIKQFGELCAVAARELGYGELSTLSVEDRIRVEGEAKLYVEQWEETVEMRTNFTRRGRYPIS